MKSSRYLSSALAEKRSIGVSLVAYMSKHSVDQRKDVYMKRVGYLYHKIYDKENINKAIINASKGKRHKRAVKWVLKNQDRCVEDLHRVLKNKQYKANKYFESHIKDGISGKARVIYKPKFYPDQVIHWCLMLVIEEYLARGLYKYSCASIPRRGTLYAKRAVERWVRKDFKNTKYCLKIDIKKYYPSVDKDKLKMMFRKIIKDKNTLWLIDEIVDSHHTGLPIGNYTSQWFANFYLQEIDHYIKQELKIKYYIRYMDDMCMFGPNKKKLHKAKRDLDKKLKEYNLKIKENWQVFNTRKRNLDFVGFVYLRDKTFIRKRISLRMIRKSKKAKANISYKHAAAVISYNGWLKYTDAFMFAKKHYHDINFNKVKEAIRNGG